MPTSRFHPAGPDLHRPKDTNHGVLPGMPQVPPPGLRMHAISPAFQRIGCSASTHPAVQVAFARVVLKGSAHELVPPPLNLLRRSLVLAYIAGECLCGHCTLRLHTLYRFVASDGNRAYRDVSNEGNATVATSTSSFAVAAAPSNEEAEDVVDHHDTAKHGLSTVEVACIWQFLRKASSPEVRLFPSGALSTHEPIFVGQLQTHWNGTLQTWLCVCLALRCCV